MDRPWFLRGDTLYLSSVPALASLENFGLKLRIFGLYGWDAITLKTQNSQKLARRLRTLLMEDAQ